MGSPRTKRKRCGSCRLFSEIFLRAHAVIRPPAEFYRRDGSKSGSAEYALTCAQGFFPSRQEDAIRRIRLAPIGCAVGCSILKEASVFHGMILPISLAG